MPVFQLEHLAGNIRCCIFGRKRAGSLKQDAADMVKLDVRKTPTLFINGKPLREFSPEGLASQVASEIRIAYKP